MTEETPEDVTHASPLPATEVIHAEDPPEVAPETPEVISPIVTLATYAEMRSIKPWLLAALRTECPIEQHHRHGYKSEHHAEYLAHTAQHGKTVAQWDELAHKFTNLPVGSL